MKSRNATDNDGSVIVNPKTYDAFDFLIAAFLNIGNFLSRKSRGVEEGRCAPEFYTFPAGFVREHRNKASKWGKISLKASPFIM